MRLIDPIELKRSIVASNIIGDGKTLEELIDEQPDAQLAQDLHSACADTISRQAAIEVLNKLARDNFTLNDAFAFYLGALHDAADEIKALPAAQPERLNDDDFETIRIHLNAFKEELCNQRRWKEAEEYQRIIDRFMAFASAQPEPLTDKEQRIFLAAMGREEKVCEEVDRNYVREPYEDSLMRVCREIKRKVKGALWT